MISTSITVRAREAEHIAQMIRMGEGQAQLCEIEPRPIFIVTVEAEGRPEEVLATFADMQAATEAAEALERQLRAELGTEGQGLKLATRDGVTIQ